MVYIASNIWIYLVEWMMFILSVSSNGNPKPISPISLVEIQPEKSHHIIEPWQQGDCPW